MAEEVMDGPYAIVSEARKTKETAERMAGGIDYVGGETCAIVEPS